MLRIIVLITLFFVSFNLFASELIVVGQIPNKYIKARKGRLYERGYVYIKDRVIQEVERLNTQASFDALSKKYPNAKIIVTTSTGKFSTRGKFDYIFPGLIDLHNHTKQNVLGVWSMAKGQFSNRFEWRKLNEYKYSVSSNMNPWISYGKPIECAAFRWSEMQALTLGVTYLQGPSSCVKDFLVHQVEDKDSYISNKEKVSAPTDLIMPGEMTYVWDNLKPLIEKGMTYEEALAKDINETCDLEGITAETVNERSGLKLLTDKALLAEKCNKKTVLHKKFIRYVYWIHPTIAGRKKYFQKDNHAALIAHLAEGRRDDLYNKIEFDLVKLLGLVRPHVNFVHGVGMSEKDFKEMGENQMGLIWSPYSNLLLYGQTLDIKSAHNSKVILALGSDWQPTGSKGVLEELKLAADYIDRDQEGENLKSIFNDEYLYDMVTKNPAQMINHWEIDVAKKEHGIGRLEKGAMGSIITASKLHKNPYTSLVRKTWASDINLVVIDGNPTYGNESYMKQAGFKNTQYEKLPTYSQISVELKEDQDVPKLAEAGATKEAKEAHLVTLGKYANTLDFQFKNGCQFKKQKVMIHQDSLAQDSRLVDFKEQTGLNLDRFHDLHKLLMINVMSQSRNLNEPTKGKVAFATQKFTPLYSCHEEEYLKRLTGFVNPAVAEPEMIINRQTVESGEAMYQQQSVPAKMAEDYGLAN